MNTNYRDICDGNEYKGFHCYVHTYMYVKGLLHGY